MAHNRWHSSRRALLAGLLSLGLSRAFAQDAVLDAQEQEQPPSRNWTTFGDLWIGYDHVSGLPGGRANLSRVRGRARLGGIWNFAAEWEIGGALRVADGSDANRDNRRNNDNERSDSIGLDQLFVRWHASETTSITAGKTPLAFDLSPMLWDQDLRPAGVTFDHSIALGEFDRLQLGAAALAGQNLYGDKSRIGALQAAWRWHEGAPLSGSVLLSYIDFGNIEELEHQGMARTNSLRAGSYGNDYHQIDLQYVNDYHLLDLQLIGRYKLAHWPIELRLDRVHNLGADVARDGTRGSLTVGDRLQPQGWEFGYANQRIQRDAVLAAFNSDEWWFHSATRGQLAWVGYGLDATWNLRLSGFRERRDGLSRDTNRLRLDLSARW